MLSDSFLCLPCVWWNGCPRGRTVVCARLSDSLCDVKLQEFQAKKLFESGGIPVPRGMTAGTAVEAASAALQLGTDRVVVKAQVLVGGRGKAGGIKVVLVPKAREAAESLLGKPLKGFMVNTVLIEPALSIAQEIYLSVTLDRARHRAVVMASGAGGVDIEELAVKSPEKIVTAHADPAVGLRGFQARQLAYDMVATAGLDWAEDRISAFAGIVLKLYDVYLRYDCSLAEINPLVVTADGKLIAADGKVDVDDNATFRQPQLVAQADRRHEDPDEIKAKEAGLSYIRLDGSIGCVVNGAGLAMATLDLVKHYGGNPANFLDIGGSSNPAKVTAAMQILSGNASVKAILFNIFGGITRCDDVARGLLEALSRTEVKIPLVIRLTGTNEAAARELLSAAGMKAHTQMDDAVKEAVAAAERR